MKKNVYLLDLFFLCLLFALATSCKNDSVLDGLPLRSNTYKINSDLGIIHSLGFDTTNVVMTDYSYIVEGDIAFEKNKIQEYAKQTINTRQAQHSSLVTPINVKFVRFKIDNSLYYQSDWRDAILKAISEYNNIGGSLIHFVEVSPNSNYDVLIKENTTFPVEVLGEGTWPSNGKVGPLVKINSYYNYLSLSQKVFLIVHELGHNLGLRHTNWKGEGESMVGLGIPGTPNTGDNPDPYSVMNGSTGGFYWGGFSHYDLLALRKLYPIKLNLNVSTITANVNENVSYTIVGEIPTGATVLWESSDMTLISGQNTKNAIFKTSGAKFKTVKATVSYNGTIISQLDNSQLWVGVPYYVSSPNYEQIVYRSRTNYGKMFHLTAKFNGYPMVYKWTVNGSPLSIKYLDTDSESISILYKYLIPGDYTYTVTATNSCGESSIIKFKIKVVNR